MTRIALVPSAYLPALGGVEELTRHLALTLRDAGDDVEVWTGRDPRAGLPVVEEMDGMVVRRFAFELPAASVRALARFPGSATRALVELRRAAAAFRPDLLHVQCFGPNGAYAAALARLCRLPLVVTLQGETMMDDDDIFDRSVVLRAALRRALSQASGVTGCSQFTLDDAERRFGLERGRGRVVFNGVGAGGDSAARPPDSAQVPDPDRRYIFAVGRVVEKKGFDLLIRAFSLVAPSHPLVDVVIGGAGPVLPELQDLARELGIADRVQFPGRLTREEVPRVMDGAAVFVMPSRLEPFGIVTLEGWRSGTPVVATTRGGPPEFVREGRDGLLVDPFETAQFAEALDTLLADPALAGRLGAAGRDRVSEFAWPVIAAQYRDVYARVLESDHRSGR